MLLLGALGAVTGAIATGMAATLRSTTLTIIIRTIILTATSTARGKGIGSITLNTVAMLPMVTEEQRTNLGLTIASSQEAVIALGAVPVPEIVPVEAPELETGPVVVELEHAPVAEELERVPVVVDLEHDQVVVELEHAPAAAEPERDPVAVVPERGRLHVRVAVPQRTRLVIVVHLPGLVPVPAVEDLAAVAEATLEPAATGAAVAWGAAG